MILQIDIGNTKIKWRLLDESFVLSTGSHSIQDALGYDELFSTIKETPEIIQVASVVLSEGESLSAWCENRWGVVPVFAKVTKECQGVCNAYDDVRQMGVDRWLAMITAFKFAKHDCMVVDAGSACTVDLVMSTGDHVGGYIVPGIQLMRDALFRETDQVKVSSINYDGIMLGKTTQAAVSSGVQAMLLGLVVVGLDKLIELGAVEPKIIFAGGDGQFLADLFYRHLKTLNRLKQVDSITYKENLVFDGLSLVNE